MTSEERNSALIPQVSPKIYSAIQRVGVTTLARSQLDQDLRPVLASLVRMSLIASLDKSSRCLKERSSVLEVLSRIELVNNLVALLSIDFHALENDVKKELQLRQKLEDHQSQPSSSASNNEPAVGSILIQNLALGPALEFERSDATRRLRLVLSELLVILNAGQPDQPITPKRSELFDHMVYFSEVCDVLNIAMAELPSLLDPAEVCESLLRLKFGAIGFVPHLVANQPDSFDSVIGTIIRNGDKQNVDNEASNSVRCIAVAELCRMNPAERANVRQKCVEWCKLPSLLFQLTNEIDQDNDEDSQDDDDLIGFLTGVLLGSDQQIRSWISFFIRSAQKKRNEHLERYRQRLLGKLRQILAKLQNSQQKEVEFVKASALIRLYSALKGIAGLKFSEEEASTLLHLLMLVPKTISKASSKFVSLGLSAFVACNSTFMTSSAANQNIEKRIVDWIRGLLDAPLITSHSIGEILLLLAIHFHSHQLNSVTELVCQTLGMRISVRTNSLGRLKAIFTHEIFTENVVAAHAAQVPVTKGLNSKMSGFLPVHCIQQLLKSRAFSKHQVPIKTWVYQQILASGTPVHPLMKDLIESFVNTVLIPATNRIQETNEPFSEAEIDRVFKADNYNNAAKILTLYYVTLYEHVRLINMRAILGNQRKALKYSHELMARLPIKFLLRMAERDEKKYGVIYPQLLKICTTRYPHLCLVQDWLDEDEESAGKTIPSNSDDNEEDILCPSKLSLLAQKSEGDHEEFWKYHEQIVSRLPELLEESTPRRTRELVKIIWFKLNRIHPRKLWASTCDALKIQASTLTKNRLGQEDLVLDPLQVIRCDRRVFRVGPILEMILYMLKACLAASRTHLANHLLDHPILDRHHHQVAAPGSTQVTNDMEREELKNALVATQESAAVQILLESMVPTSEEKSLLSDIGECQSLICSYLHEAFIQDPNLAKLVHFQGYPNELLPVLIRGVPSMHICLDFGPELLSQPDPEKQAFAVNLISHLSVHFSLPKSYSITRLAVNSLSTLLSVLSLEERNILFPQVLPALVRFCQAFPPIVEDVFTLLIQYGKIVVSEAATVGENGYSSPRNLDVPEIDNVEQMIKLLSVKDIPLAAAVHQALNDIVKVSLLEKNAF